MIDFIDDKNLTPTDDYYTSAKVTIDHLKEEEKAEIKSSEPIQVRITFNGSRKVFSNCVS